MTTYEWISDGGGGSATPSGFHDIQILFGLHAGWTFERAIVSYECSYQFVESAATPVGTWLPQAIAVYWRGGVTANTPRDLSDTGGDYSEYRGVNWDDGVTPLGTPAAWVHNYYAPRDGLPLDVKGRRRMEGDLATANGLWLSCQPAVTGTIAPGYQNRVFMFTFNARILVSH